MIAALTDVLTGASPAVVFGWLGDAETDVLAAAETSGWTPRLVDTRAVRSREDLYDQLVTDWQLPAWFGRNLDAWWDVLGELSVGPLLVEWVGAEALAAAAPELAQQVLDLLVDAAGQAASLAVVVRDGPQVAETLGLSDLDGLL